MASPIFVRDAQGRPLMPMAAAYARKLVKRDLARFVHHYAFTVVQLAKTIADPVLRPVVVGIIIHRSTAELLLVAEGERQTFPLLWIIVDLHTDLPRRLRRRAEHRRRRRARGRYRVARRYGLPFKLRRPSERLSHHRVITHQRSHKAQRRNKVFRGVPTIRWRAQAIERVITVLRTLVPLSHIAMLTSAHFGNAARIDLSPAEQRRQLISVYGKQTQTGKRTAACAYCGTISRPIEIDHILPKSRGGTDGWNNLVLACDQCNARKGDRTPEEAGMTLHVQPERAAVILQRSYAYSRQTAYVLSKHLAKAGFQVLWQPEVATVSGSVSDKLWQRLLSISENPARYAAALIAKPRARPRKQRFTSRNYSQTTPLRPPFQRVGSAVKRQVRVNRGLALEYENGRLITRVVKLADTPPTSALHVVEIGQLIETQRAGQVVIGIVASVHSTGRLTLLMPTSTNGTEISWQRVTVSPRLHLRVLSTDSVIFFPIPVAHPEGSSS